MKFITYLASIIVISLVVSLAANNQKQIEASQDTEGPQIRALKAEIDNLNYQLNQCKMLYRGQ